MRSLKKLLEKIYRKSALALVRRESAGLPPEQPAADTAASSTGGPEAAADSAAPQADGSAAGKQPPAAGSEAPEDAAAPGGSADGEPAAAESAKDISNDGQLPDNSPQVSQQFGGIVCGPSTAPTSMPHISNSQEC